MNLRTIEALIEGLTLLVSVVNLLWKSGYRSKGVDDAVALVPKHEERLNGHDVEISEIKGVMGLAH
jgi:hypothetical protein